MVATRMSTFSSWPTRFRTDGSRAYGNSTRWSVRSPLSPLSGRRILLDMLDDGRLLYDRGGFFAGELAALKERLDKLGSKRIWKGDAWYWDLKPDFKPGDEIVLF